MAKQKKKKVNFLSEEGVQYLVDEINKDILDYAVEEVLCDVRHEVLDHEIIAAAVTKEVNAFAKKEIMPAVKKYLKENKAQLIEQKINQLVARM